MVTNYKDTSIFNGVPQRSFFVDYLDSSNATIIQSDVNDSTIIISHTHNLRPDLLSNELYGTPDLWWVFTLRNPDLLLDPIYDFITGKEIKIPTSERVFGLLGRA